MSSKSYSYSQIFFALSLALVLYLFYRLVEPFLIAIVLAVTIAVLFYPLYRRLDDLVGRSRGLSSILMCSVITLLIILPLAVVILALFDELNNAYAQFQEGIEQNQFLIPQESFLGEVLQHFKRVLGVEGMAVTEAFSTLLDQLLSYLINHASEILGGIGSVVASFSIMIFSLFFFFRDGEKLLSEMKTLIPLAPEYEEMLLSKLKQIIDATFFGILLTAIGQGVAAAGVFWLLSIPNPVLWGTATAFFAVVPVVGTAAIWVPLSVYLMLTGYVVKGILLLILGATVIGLLDNLIRPLVIEERSGGIHLLMVFFGLLGGLLVFGPAGLVIGPLIAAMVVAFLEIYKIEFADQLSPGGRDD